MASEVWRTLQETYGEVRKLYDDVYPPVFARQGWTGSTYARKTLSDEVQVEVWYLAEHFLLCWNDWAGLCNRYLRYFGQPDEKVPGTWRRLANHCRSLAYQLLHDQLLDQLVARSWFHPPAVRRFLGDDHVSPPLVYHAIATNHRRLTLIKALDSSPALDPVESGRAVPEGPVWPEASDIVRRVNLGLIQEWDELPKDLRETTLWHLKHYQRANLVASWLTPEDDRAIDQIRSALLHALRKDEPVIPSIEQFVGQLNISLQERDIVSRVLHRVQAAISDFGYDSFVEDITAGEFLGGTDSPVGSKAINLIPSERRGACSTTLLAVSKGDKKVIGFPSTMKQVRDHLIRCIDKTRVVIVLCDHWFPGMLDDHLGDLRAHHDRGVRFLFLMVGTPGRAVAPVAVDLGLAP